MKTTKNLKTIITCILVACIMLTGIGIDNTATVNAATTASYVQKWGTVTMKPGDTKKVIVTDTDGNDITTKYKWTSSDKSIVKVNMDFVSQSDFTECLELIAAGSGTATLTGNPTGVGYGGIELTVTVKMAGPTAKQKKCKHSWKVTKKATCERAGVKTCKKCKLQKSIKRTGHKYVNTKITETEYDGYEYIVKCSGCDCAAHGSTHCKDINPSLSCDYQCNFTAVVTTKRLDHVAYPFHYDEIVYLEDFGCDPDDIYTWNPAIEEAINKVHWHAVYDVKSDYHGAYEDIEYGYGEHKVTKTVKVCKYCGKQK